MNCKLGGRDALAAGIAAALVVSLGCGEGTNDFTTESPDADGGTALSSAAASVPVLGQLFSTCTEDGTAFLIEFIETDAAGPLLGNTPLGELPTLESLLLDNDGQNSSLGLPILAGILPESVLSADQAAALLPGGVIPEGTPILGLAPITCADGLVPADLTVLGNYAETLGAIPVFGPTAEGSSVELVGAVLGVVGAVGATDPTDPGESSFPIPLRGFDIANGNLSSLTALQALIQSLLDILMLNV